MPNPLDALRKAQTIGADPEMSQVTQSVMPMLPEGALAGLAGLVGKWLPRAAKVVPGAIQGLPEGAETMIQRLSAGAKPVVDSMQRAGAFAGDRTVGGLNSLASKAATSPAMQTLGEVNPEFTASGGEGLYNVAKTGLKKVIDPVESAYNRLLASGGR